MAEIAQIQPVNMYNTAATAPQLPAQFQVTPQPIVGSNDLKNIQDQHSQIYQQAMNFGRMNPDVVLKALSSGGALSNVLGFSSAGDVSGLTPEQVMELTKGRSVNESLLGTQKTLDAITGAPEIRQMLTHQADQQFGVNANMLAQQNAQALAAQQANAGHAMQLAIDQANLGQRAAEFNAGAVNQHQNHLEQIHSTEKIAAAANANQLQIAKAQMALQYKMHQEQQQLGIMSAQTQKQWEMAQADHASYEKLLSSPPSQASNMELNNLLMRHPEWNANGVFYQDGRLGGAMPFSHTPIPVKLTPATLKDGSQIWMTPTGEYYSPRVSATTAPQPTVPLKK